MRKQCVVNCFWKNKYWSVGDIYEGTERTPFSKKGVEFFIGEGEKQPEQDIKNIPASALSKQTDEFLKKWELSQMPKIELQRIMRTKYGVVVKDEITKSKLIEMILNKQIKNPSNQEIANTTKI